MTKITHCLSEPDELDLTDDDMGGNMNLKPDETLLLFQEELEFQLANKTGPTHHYTL